MRTALEVQQDFVEKFKAFPSWEERYKAIIELGKHLEPYPEAFRNEDHKVRGCQSQVWLHAVMPDTASGNSRGNAPALIHFYADSDAVIVRGLVALLLSVYNDRSADEILTTPVGFLKDLGLESHLSPSRANGLYSMLKQILFYATAFKAKGRTT